MNLKLAYRPLLGGVGIVASSTRKWATLGLVAEGHGQRWAVTAAHVIGDVRSHSWITVFQGPWNAAGQAICDVDMAHIKIDLALDIAAVPLLATVAARPEMAHLGAWGLVAAPVKDMEVVRVGVGSGVSRGVIESVAGSEVRICRPSTYPLDYSVGESGDSGSVWMAWPGLELVALHRAKTNDGIALATAMTAALPALSLVPVQ